MTREDIINNIRSNYNQYGVDMEQIEDNIRTGEAQGFSYQTIYTGIRMALATVFNTNEYFTPAELAESFGTTEEEIIKEIEDMRATAEAVGIDPNTLAYKTEPQERKKFIIPAGFLS